MPVPAAQPAAAAPVGVAAPVKPAAPLVPATRTPVPIAQAAASASTDLPSERIDAALKYAKYAINSLNFEDVASARDSLKRALLELGE